MGRIHKRALIVGSIAVALCASSFVAVTNANAAETTKKKAVPCYVTNKAAGNIVGPTTYSGWTKCADVPVEAGVKIFSAEQYKAAKYATCVSKSKVLYQRKLPAGVNCEDIGLLIPNTKATAKAAPKTAAITCYRLDTGVSNLVKTTYYLKSCGLAGAYTVAEVQKATKGNCQSKSNEDVIVSRPLISGKLDCNAYNLQDPNTSSNDDDDDRSK